MNWKPNAWIAAVLSLLFMPVGLLYAQRPRLAAIYLAVSLAMGTMGIAALWYLGAAGRWNALTYFGWFVAIICALHSYLIAKDSTASAQRRWYSRWYSLPALPLAMYGTLFLLHAYVYAVFSVPGLSMYPTLPEGSVVIVDKRGFGVHEAFGITLSRSLPTKQVKRADIVAFYPPDAPTMAYLRRVVAVEGDRISYRERQLTLNGATVPLSFGAPGADYLLATERIDAREFTVAFLTFRPSRDFEGVVPPGHVVLLGDNRDNSRDSRHFGMVPMRNILGRVTAASVPKSPTR